MKNNFYIVFYCLSLLNTHAVAMEITFENPETEVDAEGAVNLSELNPEAAIVCMESLSPDHLSKIRELNLSACGFRALPSCLLKMNNLRALIANNNPKLSEGLENLPPSINVIFLDYCNINTIPTTLKKLPNLIILNLAHNPILNSASSVYLTPPFYLFPKKLQLFVYGGRQNSEPVIMCWDKNGDIIPISEKDKHGEFEFELPSEKSAAAIPV